ncbi:hypothetical protein ES703_22187 [subsurface metagenome]
MIVAQADGPVEVFGFAGHPIDTGERLEHLTVDFLVCGDDPSIFGFNRCVLPHIVQHPNHTLAPGCRSEPFGQRQQAVFDILRSSEDNTVDVGLCVVEALFGERICIRQACDAGCESGFGAEHIEHTALEERPVCDSRGKNHKRVIVCGAVLGIPDVLVSV